MAEQSKPLVLIIMDGWGYSEDPRYNAIFSAKTPVWDELWLTYPHTLINASGSIVGLPGNQMGNSEVGHLNMGAGRVVHQDFTRISNAIESGTFLHNRILTDAVDNVVENHKALHILGLLSDGGVHSHESHIHAMVEMAVKRGAKQVYIHAFLDGRDTPPKSAEISINLLEQQLKKIGSGRLVSIIGRFYSMDRDKRWQRIKKAYQLITEGTGDYHADDGFTALQMAYARGETDEFIKATSIGDPVKVAEGDSIIFMNFRADRARELTESFIHQDFDGFNRHFQPRLGYFVTLTEYKEDFDVSVAFPKEKLNNTFGGYIASLGMKQLRVAETEKYAHVTFFFNGGSDTPFEGEDRILVSSPLVDTYDEQPAMSATEVTRHLIEAVRRGKHDVIICNFANADMVGHTGNFDAAVAAIETLDQCLGDIWSALEESGGEMIVTADHGNAELMLDELTGQPHTAHTSSPVPFLYAGRPADVADTGSLSDIAPTMLSLMKLPIPMEMNQNPLIMLK